MTPATPAVVSALVRRRRRRAGGIAGLGVVAVLNVIASVRVRSTAEVGDIERAVGLATSLTARAALAVLGVGLVLVVRGLWRGQQRAWVAGVTLGAGSAVLQVLQDGSTPAAVVCAVVALALAFDRGSYRAPGRPLSAGWLILPFALAAVAGYGTAGWAEHGDGLPDLSLPDRARVVARGLIGLSPGVTGSTRQARAFLDALPLAGAAAAVATGASLLLLARPGRRAGRDRAAAAALLARHGRTSAAPLAGLPGNDLLSLRGGNALAGVRVWADVAVSVGPPVAVDGDEEAALAEYVELCERSGWTPAVLDADDTAATLGERLGFASLKLGEEAFLDLEGFTLDGKARANVRHSATRAQRDGVAVERYDPPRRRPAVDRQLAAISDAWLATKHGPELGFTLGRFDPERLGEQEVFVASAAGGAVGFVTWLPYAAGTAAVLDLMRRGEGCPPGVMELLIARSAEDLRDRGYRTVSLGGVPLASTTARVSAVERALGWVYEHGGTLYEAKGLFAFKRKFDPRWEPIYLLYPTGGDLPRIAAAVGRAFLPPGAGALTGWLPGRVRR